MNDLVVHPFQSRGVGFAAQLEKSAYPAHGYVFSRERCAAWRSACRPLPGTAGK
jgi:hypothetical protein